MTVAFTPILATVAVFAFAFGADAANQNKRSAHDARAAYLAAINSNDLDAFLGAVTEDIILIAPNSPKMEGKAEVGPWVEGYFQAFETSWVKSTTEFVVSDEWAFERYSYVVIDTPRSGGLPRTDSGNGINIYRIGLDGHWRVARDVWATNRPIIADDQGRVAPCADDVAPC